MLSHKNQGKISVGYGICDDFPFYDVNACQHADMKYSEKGKVPENRRKKILSPICTAEIWNLTLKENKLQIFLRVLPQEEKSFTKAKPEPPMPYKPENCRSGEARTFLLDIMEV